MEISELSLPEIQAFEAHALRRCSSLVTEDEVTRLTDQIGNVCEASGCDNATVLMALKIVSYGLITRIVRAVQNRKTNN